MYAFMSTGLLQSTALCPWWLRNALTGTV